MHAISSYRGYTATHKHKHTDRADYNTLRSSLERSVINKLKQVDNSTYEINSRIKRIFSDVVRFCCKQITG